jgi:hypothetical protein
MPETKEESRTIHLSLTCMKSPERLIEQEPTVFGLQDRNQVVHAGQENEDGSVSYEIDVLATRNHDNTVRLRGPYVHGTSQIPFLYLSLRKAEGDPKVWIRRLKVSLPDITWTQIETIPESTTFAARVAGTGSGTVPLLDGGWTLVSQHTITNLLQE